MKAEIKISHIHLETTLTLCEEFVQVLVVENPNEFYSMVMELNMALEGEESPFIFCRNNEMINPSKEGNIVIDVFNFDLNDKKILTLLQKRLEVIANEEKFVFFNELSSKTLSFLGEIAAQVPFSLDYDQPSPIDYFKIAGIKFEKNYESLEEKIICYINALIELKKCEFFIFVNLKSVLSNEKIEQIYAHCRAEQVGLFLIESKKLKPASPSEKVVIITEDLCEIVENYNSIC